VVVAVVGTALTQNNDAAKEQHAMIGAAHPSAAADITKDPARRWFSEAGLGPMNALWVISSRSRCEKQRSHAADIAERQAGRRSPGAGGQEGRGRNTGWPCNN
jgi:hypothetical protein